MKRALLAKRIGLATVALLLLGAVTFVAMRAGPLAPVKVTTRPVREGTLHPSIFGVGTVEARQSWMVGPTVSGRVLNVRVDVGEQVKAGQILAEMDAVDLDQRLAAQDAMLARAGSNLAAARAQLADATARREVASLSARRNQELANQNFISAAALESRMQEKASADAALQAAQANLGGTGQDIVRIQAERSGLVKQRNSLHLIAPADSVITSREAEAGSTVLAGQAVLRLIAPGSLWVRLRIDQGRSAGLSAGQLASIVLRSNPNSPIKGRVARVELIADSVTEERIAQIAFDRSTDAQPVRASLGELAEVTLQLPTTQRSNLIANASVQRSLGQTGVWRIRNGKPEFAPVKLGASSLDGQVQVLEGLQAGDAVVVYSQKALSAGTRIQVVDALVSGTREDKP